MRPPRRSIASSFVLGAGEDGGAHLMRPAASSATDQDIAPGATLRTTLTYVADRDGAAEHRGGVLAHGVLGQPDEVVVPGEDLRPVGLLDARRVVVQGGDGGLDLVAAESLHGQRRLQDAHALGDLAGIPQAAVLPVERDDPTL